MGPGPLESTRRSARETVGVIECPVCGANELAKPPYATWPPPDSVQLVPPYENTLGAPSYEVCPTCGFEFGNDDNPGTARPVSFEKYRDEWVASGSLRFDPKFLLIVADTFELTGRPGTTVMPNVERDVEAGDFEVRIRRPGARSIRAMASLSWNHFHPGGFRLVCRLPGLSKSEIPIGAEIRFV